ncbi:MAG TPA: SH3 domain-containing protein [Devosiaceae bacterium]
MAVAATAALMLLPVAASAAPATATANVNVRTGPGPGYGVVSVLTSGQRVDVQQCQGTWCLINARGTSGWVASTYLDQRGFGGGTQNLGPVNGGGISIQIPGVVIGNPPPPPPIIVAPGPGPRPPFGGPGPRPPFGGPGNGHGNGPGRPNHRDQACFYSGANFRGDSFCLDEGESMGRLRRGQQVGSIDNPDGLRVRVCTDDNFRGTCRIYTSDARDLGRFNVQSASAN